MSLDLTKLPKYVQQHIRNLERDLASATRELDEIKASGDFAKGPYGTQAPHDERLQFVDPKSGRTVTSVTCDSKTGILEIDVEGGMALQPRASNVVRIKPLHWSEF
jgi:hypothetical protein